MYVPHFLEQRTRPPTSPFADYAPATPLVPFGFGLVIDYQSVPLNRFDLPPPRPHPPPLAAAPSRYTFSCHGHGS
jgi:hypothetical protein